MKRTLTGIALAAITLASASVYAQNPNFPKPSFNDNAEIVSAAAPERNRDGSSVGGSARQESTVVTQGSARKAVPAPQPSFNG